MSSDGKRGYTWIHNAAKRLVITEDGGQSWNSTAMLGELYTMATHPTDPNIALLVNGERLYKTIDGGKQWILVKDFYPDRLPSIFKLTYDSFQHNTIYALTTVGLFRSDDEGKHWVSLNQSLPKDIQTELNRPFDNNITGSRLVVSQKTAGTVYLYFQKYQNPKPFSRVLVSEDWGASWKQLGQDIRVNQITVSPETDKPFLGNGEGIFELK